MWAVAEKRKNKEKYLKIKTIKSWKVWRNNKTVIEKRIKNNWTLKRNISLVV